MIVPPEENLAKSAPTEQGKIIAGRQRVAHFLNNAGAKSFT